MSENKRIAVDCVIYGWYRAVYTDPYGHTFAANGLTRSHALRRLGYKITK